MDTNNRNFKRTNSLRFKFAVISTIFSICILCFSGFTTYANQMKSYKTLCLENVRNVGYYLQKLILDSSKEFLYYQKYYMEHFAEVDIPYDFNEYTSALKDYQLLVNRSEQNRFGSVSDVNYGALTPEEQKAFFIYCHEYWTLTFEHAREAFNLPYTYYLVPKEDDFIMVYMIDGERSHKAPDGSKADSGKYLYLGDEYVDPYEKYPVQWNTWFTGQTQDDFQVWNNEWGHTYAYYIPLYIDGQKLGLIGTEIQVDNINKAILFNTLWQTGFMALGLFIFLTILMIFINHRYIHRVMFLEAEIREFSADKNPQIVEKIRANTRGKNELTLLAYQFADMILELERYMDNLLATNMELQVTKHHANVMNELANKDSLTGIRNKTAYDHEILRVEHQLSAGKKEFGIVMIDLNYLKQINDTYGHEQGSAAIKKLCKMICDTFVHSPVFRVGGDEFVVILENPAYQNVDDLITELNEKMEALQKEKGLEPWERVSAAVGYALYNEEIDSGVASVFKRADQAMYDRKREMKAERES